MDKKSYIERFKMGKTYFYHVSREEVEQRNFEGIDLFIISLEMLRKKSFEKAAISFSGYEDVSEDIWEIDDIRYFVKRTVEKYPHIFYFLDNVFEAKDIIMYCYANIDLINKENDTKKENVDDVFNQPQVTLHLNFTSEQQQIIVDGLRDWAKRFGDYKGVKETMEYLNQKFNFNATLS